MKKYLLALAICFFISACGSGGGSNANTTNTPDPSSVNVGSSTTTTVSPQQPSVTLVGIATVTLAPGDLAATPTVTITKGQDAQSAQIFTDSQADLQIQSGTDYEVVFNTTAMPTLDSTVSAIVPSALAAKVTSTQALALYYEIPADDEQPAIYRPLASNYDLSTRLISVTLPAYAYQLQSNGSYQAKIKIGIATGYAASISPNFKMAGILVGSPQSQVITDPYTDLWCPFDQCVEVSRFQANRNGRPHTGVDLRAALDTPVHAALAGKVERFVPATGTLVTSSVIGSYTFILKYTHLSMDLVFAPNLVSKGELIALSGKQGATDAHLHLDVIVPAVATCQPNVGTVGNCFFLLDYHDPFPQLIKKGVITEKSNPPVTTFAVNRPLVLSLDEVDANVTTEKPISSDVTAATPPNYSIARRVLWEVTAPNAAAFPVPAVGGNYAAFAMYPNTTTSNSGLGLLNQATFTPKLVGQYKITAQWEGTNLTASYDVTVDPQNCGGAQFVTQGGLTWMPPQCAPGGATWGAKYSHTYTWQEANAYCAGTAINGQTGWRLSTVQELAGLVGLTVSIDAIGNVLAVTGTFNNSALVNAGWSLLYLWSSSPTTAGNHYIVFLNGAGVFWSYDTGIDYVTCVR